MIAAIKAQTDALEKLPQAIAMAVAEAMKAVQPSVIEVVTKAPETAHETTIQLGNFGNSHTSPARKPSPKLEFAIQWLKQNPADMLKPGRELEAQVTMNGEPISYKWWNEAKKLTGST